jgi:hypothetical protein
VNVILILRGDKKNKSWEQTEETNFKKKTFGFGSILILKEWTMMFLFIFKLLEDINFLYMLEFQLIKIEQ